MDPRYYNPLQSTTYRETTRDELQAAAYALDLEYRSEGVRIDKVNIDKRLQSQLLAKKLNIYSVYIPLVRKLINEENQTYIVPPQRYFVRKNGAKVGERMTKYLTDLYKKFDFNRKMLEFERQAAYEGTVLVRPVIDKDLAYFVKLVPSDATLEVDADPRVANKAGIVQYETGEDEEKIVHIWDPEFYTIRVQENGQDVEYSEPHGYEGSPPFAVLRYENDSRRFWGPYDGGLYSFAKLRSLLMADSVHRTQVSLYEIMVMAGFSLEEAQAATETRQTGKFIAYEYEETREGNVDPKSKDVRFESPEGIESTKVLEVYFQLYNHFIVTRGHALKNFEVGKQPQAAEAIWFGDNALRSLQMSRRHPLAIFENQVFNLVRWENNRRATAPTESSLFVPGLETIPEDIEVGLDWVPDPIYFVNATDKVNYYRFMLQNGLKDHASIIRMENPDLSREQAIATFEENQELLTKYGIDFNLSDVDKEDSDQAGPSSQ